MLSRATQIRRKLVIIGDGAAGKTSLLNVFAVGHFPENYVSPAAGCLIGGIAGVRLM